MSDLVLFVAAALRDKALHDLIEEHQTLREENASLASRIETLTCVSLRSPRGQYLEMQPPTGQRAELDPESSSIGSIQELLDAQVWLGRPSWLFLDSLNRLLVDSVLYTRVDATAVDAHDHLQDPNTARVPAAHHNRTTRIRIETRWVSIHMVVVGTSRPPGLDQDVAQLIMLGGGDETVADVLRIVQEDAETAETAVHQIEIHSPWGSRAFNS